MAYCRDAITEKFAGLKHSTTAQPQRCPGDIAGLCDVEESDVAYCLGKTFWVRMENYV